MSLLQERSLDDRVSALFASEPDALAEAPQLYRELRERMPVFDHRDALIFSRHADARALLPDGRSFGKADRYMNDTVRQALTEMTHEEQQAFAQLSAFERQALAAADGAEHERQRGIMHRAMTPRRIAALEQSVHDATQQLLEPLDGAGVADIMQFAYRLPLLVISDLLGIPPADREQIHDWTRAIAYPKGGILHAAEVMSAHQALAEFRAYLDAILADHRANPGGSDLLSALMDAEGDRLTSGELAANFVMLLLAGHETTTNLIGTGLLELLRVPGQWDALCDAPERAPAAVEELLRFVSPVQWVLRIPAHDFAYGGMTIPKARLIFVALAAVNRDPAVFSSPERLDIARSDAGNHIAFGMGPHYCLGASMTRLEGRIAFETLCRRYPKMQLRTEEVQWRGTARLRGLAELPVALGPRHA
jgi:cytochrome P450